MGSILALEEEILDEEETKFDLLLLSDLVFNHSQVCSHDHSQFNPTD